MSLASRALDHEECWDRAACEIGILMQSVRDRSPEWFDYAEGFSRMFIPSRFNKTYETYMGSARHSLDCSSFSCLTDFIKKM